MLGIVLGLGYAATHALGLPGDWTFGMGAAVLTLIVIPLAIWSDRR